MHAGHGTTEKGDDEERGADAVKEPWPWRRVDDERRVVVPAPLSENGHDFNRVRSII